MRYQTLSDCLEEVEREDGLTNKRQIDTWINWGQWLLGLQISAVSITVCVGPFSAQVWRRD